MYQHYIFNIVRKKRQQLNNWWLLTSKLAYKWSFSVLHMIKHIATKISCPISHKLSFYDALFAFFLPDQLHWWIVENHNNRIPCYDFVRTTIHSEFLMFRIFFTIACALLLVILFLLLFFFFLPSYLISISAQK